MRNDQEIIDLILSYARSDDNIRLVVMNGSRVNPHVKKDPFQDFDIACLVRDIKPYLQNHQLADRFGDVMILQTPEDMGDAPQENFSHYAYLMQFMDGIRIDLSFHTVDRLEEVISDSLTVVLLDKDNRDLSLPAPSDVGYYPRRPSEKQFFDCCNEFWWVTPYVAKGLWRDQITYARYYLDTVLRNELMKMLVWYFGVQTDFQKSPGDAGKYLKTVLDPAVWCLLESTYCDARPESTWEALLAMGELFRQLGRGVAAHFHFTYPEPEDRNVTRYIQDIRNLPHNAK